MNFPPPNKPSTACSTLENSTVMEIKIKITGTWLAPNAAISGVLSRLTMIVEIMELNAGTRAIRPFMTWIPISSPRGKYSASISSPPRPMSRRRWRGMWWGRGS